MKGSYQKTSVKFLKLRNIFFLLALITITLTGRVNSATNDEDKSAEIMNSIQVGILTTVQYASQDPDSFTKNDFMDKEIVTMEDSTSAVAPYRRHNKCTFTSYAPRVFNYIRKLLGVNDNDFISSMYTLTLKKIQTSGRSGASFYKSGDDRYIIKTVKKREAEFLQESLSELLKNLKDNPNTLLPKFLGLYGYTRHFTKKIIVVMKNLLPSYIQFYQIYDLKGSTYNRDASKLEKQKKTPTYKDNDFIRMHPTGIHVDDKVHTALSQIIKQDCKLLERLHVTDYSLLLGICNNYLVAKQISRIVLISQGGIPALNVHGEKSLLFMGIIDILTYYGNRKKMEYLLKAPTQGNTASVLKPSSYAERFHKFITKSVLIPTKNQ